MPEYLVLMKLNPSKILETLDSIRGLEERPVSGVDLCYSMNIFGTWDACVLIAAKGNSEALDFVQKKVNSIDGVTEVYTVPTFPHGNHIQSGKKVPFEP